MHIAVAWCHLVQFGTDLCNLVQNWCNFVQFGATWYRLLLIGADWFTLADFKILAVQTPKFKTLAYFKILAFQNPEFKIPSAFKILALQLHSLSSHSATAVAPFMDVFLFKITKANKGDTRLCKTTTLIRVATDASLVDLKALVRAQSESVIYTPARGFLWLRKGLKQLVELKSEEHLQNCKSDDAKGGKPATGIPITCSSRDLEAGWF